MRYEMSHPIAIEAGASERARFIRRTYAHLAGAILAFAAIEFAIFKMLAPVVGLDQLMMRYFTSVGLQLVMLFAFIGVGYLARYWASNGGSVGMQYAGLALFIVMEAVLFVPILYIAQLRTGYERIIAEAGILTLSLFAGLTATVFITGKDFSFLGSILSIGGFIMLGIVLCAFLLPGGLQLGMWWSVLGIILAAGFILYDTSNVLHHFRTDQHVAASLDLFASVAYLFFHVLRLLMLSRSGD